MTDEIFVTDEITVIEVTEESAVVIETPAEQGPPGANGVGLQMVRQATIAIGGHRVVCTDSAGHVAYADPSDLSTLATLLGLTINAAAPGDILTIVPLGEISDSAWTWTPGGALYLGANGTLVQTSPVGAFLCWIGHAVTATTIFFNPREPIVTA